eukprot:TRINITY_DN52382_c0_g1_i1.p1 TRINITY_DN52382_c0_g1~~TRINITY_DN52382_c0_g1_i1.p1  ORF type:complete len:471 (-),score=68.04 TRINITY_DN52382_c0_g1_i1:143-1555(-)
MAVGVPSRGADAACFLRLAGFLLGARLVLAAVVTEKHQKTLQRRIDKKSSKIQEGFDFGPFGLSKQTWGDALQLSDSLHLSENLTSIWPKHVMDSIITEMRKVPKIPSTEGEMMIFESRLGKENDQVDYSVAYMPQMFPRLVEDSRLQELAAASSQWKMIFDFMKVQTKGYVAELFLEFDQPTGPMAPSLFVGPNTPIRDALMRQPLLEILGAKLSETSSDHIAQLLEPLLKLVWSPFWSAMPWINETQVDVRRQVGGMIFNGRSTVSVYQVGFWLARDTGTIRLVLEHELVYDEPWLRQDRAEWWSKTLDELTALGWRWTDEERPELLNEMMPLLLEGPSHFYSAVNVQGSGISPKIGFEIYFDESLEEEAKAAGHPFKCSVKSLLRTLVKLKLCTTEKARALVAFKVGGIRRRVVYNEDYDVTTKINHVKVTFEPGVPPEAKVYILERWALKTASGTKAKVKERELEL